MIGTEVITENDREEYDGTHPIFMLAERMAHTERELQM